MGVIDDTQSTRRRRLAPLEGVPLLVANGSEDTSSNNVSPAESSQSKRDAYNYKNGRRRRRKHRSSKHNKEESPFWVLVLQVGTTLMVICLLTFHLYQWVWPPTADPYGYDDDDGGGMPQDLPDGNGEDYKSEQEAKLAEILRKESEKEIKQQLQEIQNQEELEAASQPKPPPPIPMFDLSESSRYDAFGIAHVLNVTSSDSDGTRVQGNIDFWRAAEGLKRRFADTYGGENAARMLLDRGLSTFATDHLTTIPFAENSEVQVPTDVVHTACRFKNAREEKRPFSFAFGGYSVTAGRGNFFSQSFPLVMEQLLHTSFRLAGIELKVRNAAIGTEL